jgi:ketopantoate reductase
MSTKLEVLVLGASYGSLLASKFALAGHNVHLVCLPDEASAINQHGVELRLPVRGRDELVVVNSKQLSGKISAGAAADVDAGRYDLVALAMQEPQYGNPEIRALLQRIADAKVPCMSIMNMPPLTYLRRIPGLDCDSLRTATSTLQCGIFSTRSW